MLIRNAWPLALVAVGCLMLGLPASADDEAQIVMLTGPQGGTYHFMGMTIRGVSNRASNIQVVSTPGSFENMIELATGRADFAFVQMDMLAEASRMEIGKHILDQVRIVLPLYREEIHILVRADSGIESVGMLLGRRVAVGSIGSGTYYSAQQFLAAFGIDIRASIDPVYASPADAVDLLVKDRVDAVFLTGGVPLKTIADYPEGASRAIKLLNLPNPDISRIMENTPGYEMVTIRPGDYPIVKSDVQTLATQAVLVARTDVDGQVVQDLLRDIFSNIDSLSAGHRKWREVSLDRAVQMQSHFMDRIQYHDGALAFFPPRERRARVHVLLSGSSGGTYSLFGKSIAKAARNGGVGIKDVESAGSLRNLFAVAFGRADFGLVQLDVLSHFVNSDFGEILGRNLRVVTPLYNEEIHVLCRKGAGIKSIEDLKGKRVHVGAAGSGSRWSAGALLDGKGHLRTAMEGTASAVADLQSGKLDAIIFTGGQPVEMFQMIAAEGDNEVELLNLTDEETKKVLDGKGVYSASEIPAASYPWQAEGVRTIATPCVLIANRGVEDAVIEDLLGALHEQSSMMAAEHAKWGSLSADWSKKFLKACGLPVHPGAMSYYTGE